jgi:hypothetical protein
MVPPSRNLRLEQKCRSGTSCSAYRKNPTTNRRSIPSPYHDNRHTDRQATAWLHAYRTEHVLLAEAAWDHKDKSALNSAPVSCRDKT